MASAAGGGRDTCALQLPSRPPCSSHDATSSLVRYRRYRHHRLRHRRQQFRHRRPGSINGSTNSVIAAGGYISGTSDTLIGATDSGTGVPVPSSALPVTSSGRHHITARFRPDRSPEPACQRHCLRPHLLSTYVSLQGSRFGGGPLPSTLVLARTSCARYATPPTV